MSFCPPWEKYNSSTGQYIFQTKVDLRILAWVWIHGVLKVGNLTIIWNKVLSFISCIIDDAICQARQNRAHCMATILLKYSYIMMFISYLSARWTSTSTYLWFALNTVVDVRHFAKTVCSNVLTQPILASKSIVNISVSSTFTFSSMDEFLSLLADVCESCFILKW